MQHTRRALGLGAAAVAALAASACSSFADQQGASGASSGGTSSSLTQAAQASPGVYGTRTTPSPVPVPTAVATDPPVSLAPQKQAAMVVTFSGWDAPTTSVQASGYLPGVAEDGGTCTLTLTKGATTVTGTVAGTANVTNTSCGGLSVPGSRLASGTWSAVISYRSRTSSGASAPVQVTVP